jgi:predicted RNA binding protein YcfA (HicA-like mRNA interferase family)
VSPALSDLPVRRVIRALEGVGFSHVRTKGSHAVYRDRRHGRRVMKVTGHSPNAHRPPPRGRSMKYRMLGRTGIEGGDVALDDERPTGL